MRKLNQATKRDRRRFTLNLETREDLAKVLHRPLRDPAVIRAVINDLERLTRDFVETKPMLSPTLMPRSWRRSIG